MTDLPDNLRAATGNMLLSIADDKLMVGHRNADWTGLGPLRLDKATLLSACPRRGVASPHPLSSWAEARTSLCSSVIR